MAWTNEAVQRGAGDVLLNSMDKDGTKDGFDLELIKLIRPNISVPLIASGGAGKITDFYPAVLAGADALLAASVFHFKEIEIANLKMELKKNNVEVRDRI